MIHYQSDLILSIGVIISLWLTTKIGWFFIDPLFGGAISVWIIYGAIKIAKKSITQLMDQELSNEDRKKIESIALNHPEVKAIHDLKTRSAGPNSFIQIHLEMDGEMMLNQAHEISKTVEREIMKSFPNSEIIIHQDPLN